MYSKSFKSILHKVSKLLFANLLKNSRYAIKWLQFLPTFLFSPGEALDWFLQLQGDLQNWPFLVAEFRSRFRQQNLSIREKLAIRKNLFQSGTEKTEEFLERCIQAQFAITDENSDLNEAAFQRDVLLNFLMGMRPTLQSKVNRDLERICQYLSKLFTPACQS